MMDELDDDTKSEIHDKLLQHLIDAMGKGHVMDKFPDKHDEVSVTKVSASDPKLLDLPEVKDSVSDDADELPELHIETPDGPTETEGEHAGMHTVGNMDDEDVPNLVKRLRNLKK